MLSAVSSTQVLLRSSSRGARRFAIVTTGEANKSHSEKNATRGRPLSPHVLVYAFPLAAIASITHRVTGFGLTVGVYGMGLTALAGGDVAEIASAIGNSALGPLAKMVVAFPLVYHTAGGVRHLYWERFPEGLNPASQRQASMALFGVSGLLALGLGMV
jgi:succinate dehydrogenase cytochrome b556 subunit